MEIIGGLILIGIGLRVLITPFASVERVRFIFTIQIHTFIS
jgi:putative Mn2+ efflux pump MntP